MYTETQRHRGVHFSHLLLFSSFFFDVSKCLFIFGFAERLRERLRVGDGTSGMGELCSGMDTIVQNQRSSAT